MKYTVYAKARLRSRGRFSVLMGSGSLCRSAVLGDPSMSLSPAVQSALRKWTHKSRKNAAVPAGESVPELQIRDLRQLDTHFDHQEEPYVLVRRHCVLISLGPQLRVIVQSKRLLILAHQDDESDREQTLTLLRLLTDTIHGEQ